MLLPSLAPATVEEQRARLPPPATCTDPVEGVWMSHKFNPSQADWYIFTLSIHRTAPGAATLRGDILSHSWEGTAQDQEPPPCRQGLDHWTVAMPAVGVVEPGGIVRFGGTSWRPEQTFCGHAPRPGQYNVDHFSGTIDPALQEFQSVNNDGGRSVNDPMVFRRVRCFEPPVTPHIQVAPPPFRPATRSRGCGLS
jgi:hypothetical protein